MRFRRWLLKPILGESRIHADRIVTELQTLAKADGTPEICARLEQLERVTILSDSLGKIADHAGDYAFPKSSLAFLALFEATLYAVKKFGADPQAQQALDRSQEIVAWTNRYMKESGWAVVETGMVLLMLKLVDAIHEGGQ